MAALTSKLNFELSASASQLQKVASYLIFLLLFIIPHNFLAVLALFLTIQFYFGHMFQYWQLTLKQERLMNSKPLQLAW